MLNMSSPRKLLLVEDEHLVSSLLASALRSAGFEVATADSAIEASKVATKFDPDIAVLDINLGHGASGVELAYILERKFPGIALVLLTKHPDLRTAGYAIEDLPLGCGFIRKDLIEDSEAVVEAIELVIRNQSGLRQDDDPARPLGELTANQVEVLRLVSQGYTNQAIASQRQTSVRAVEQVLKSIYSNLGIDVEGEINPRVEAVRQFISAAGTPDRT
jgi:DNA-binding NarL/FixJ family response regulator